MLFFNRRKRAPVCFLHIGKTGGTTMLGVLDGMLEPNLVCPARHMEEIEGFDPSELEKYRLFRGHFWYSVNNYLPDDTRFFTVLRDPVERAVSTYDHLRKFPHPRHEIVRKMTLEEYVDAENSVSLEVDNWQARVLTSCIDPGKTPSAEIALERLRTFPMVGITEELNKTVSLMSAVFKWKSVGEFEVRNVTPGRTDRSTISEDVLEKIRKKNEIDVLLYEEARRLFEQQCEDYL